MICVKGIHQGNNDKKKIEVFVLSTDCKINLIAEKHTQTNT